MEKIDRIGETLAKEYKKGRNADKKKLEELKTELKRLGGFHQLYVVKNEMSKIYTKNGGVSLNATTNCDTTQYFVMLPANRLELWFLMESERFKYPVLRGFYSERDVVAEEIRMLGENDPDGFLANEFYSTAFRFHRYRRPVVGYMEDLQSCTKQRARDFFKTFYIPNNMMAAVVGDIKIEEVKRLAEKYFGDIPRGKDPPRPCFKEPKQKGERRVIVRFDAEPRLLIGYHLPPYPHKDLTVLELIGIVLSGGKSSLLYKNLVLNKKIAAAIDSYSNSPGIRYPGLFIISGKPRHPHSPQQLEAAIYENLEKLKKEPVSQNRIARALNQYEASLYKGITDNLTLASRILDNVLYFVDLDAEFKKLDELKKITAQDIMETAGRIFTASNRTVGILLKKGQGEEK